MPDAGGMPLLTREGRAALRHDERRARPGLDGKIGSLTPGKEADIIILDADGDQRGAAQPRAGCRGVADGPHQRRDRDRRRQGAQVEGRLLDVDLPALRAQLEASRDYMFHAAGIPQDLFRAP